MNRKGDLSPLYLLILISLLGIGSFAMNRRSFSSKKKQYKQSNESVFTQIYEEMKWSDLDSVSGPGSDLVQTSIIRREIPHLLRELGVKTLVDAPCGDFYWMKDLKLDVEKYIGIDIVDEIILKNRRKYSTDSREFITYDLVTETIPKADLILCRDCFSLLSNEDILQILKQFKKSGSRYLLTTTYTSRTHNKNITNGDFHPINLQAAPFYFPKPILIINENCSEDNGRFNDKSLALWKLEDIDLNNVLNFK